MKKIVLLTLISIGIHVSAQKEVINQFNSNKKKDGKWIVYLDNVWKEVKDSSAASFYRYTYYDNGENIYPMGPCGRNGWKLETTNKSETGLKPALLDGDYKWVDKKGQLSSTHVFINGEYQDCKEYFKDGKLSQHFAYTKKFREQAHSYCIYHYSKKGDLKFYIMHKSRGTWLLSEGSEDDMNVPKQRDKIDNHEK
jgi:hypothetical protein